MYSRRIDAKLYAAAPTPIPLHPTILTSVAMDTSMWSLMTSRIGRNMPYTMRNRFRCLRLIEDPDEITVDTRRTFIPTFYFRTFLTIGIIFIFRLSQWVMIDNFKAKAKKLSITLQFFNLEFEIIISINIMYLLVLISYSSISYIIYFENWNALPMTVH